MERENELKQKLQEFQKQLGKKQMFEEAVSSITSLLRELYPSASPSLRKSFYTVISRAATILKTRYTAPGFWKAGLVLFLEAEKLVSESSEREHLRSCIAKAREQLSEVENQPEESAENSTSQAYLFEGHLTVDREPPPPDWLEFSNLMATAISCLEAGSSQVNSSEEVTNLLPPELMARIQELVPIIVEDNPDDPKVPPASKEVVAKLPVITITEEILAKLGPDGHCAICKENLVANDVMQELPCKHMFHPPCLKPWLDEHNSCPTCRYELQTDDHAYEHWKQRVKEAAEERKGAENAVREGTSMYV